MQQVVKPFVFIYLHPLSEYFHGIVTCPRPGYTGLVVLVFKKNGNFMSRSTIETCNTSIISFQRLHKLLHNLPYLCFLKELALLRNIKRTASVVVREDAELLVVEKDVFSKTCPKIFDKELVDKIKFCK